MTIAETEARIEALEEAASHLEQAWTDDAEEKRQGRAVSAMLRREINKYSERLEFMREMQEYQQTNPRKEGG